jgi:hypothetical protein
MPSQAEVASLMEGDSKPEDVWANVFIDIRRIAEVLLSIGQARHVRALVSHLGKQMGLRMPELVTLRFDSMPAEPPVDHLAGRSWKTG